MQDYNDANGGNKTGGYLATYAHLKSLRRVSMTPEQQAEAAAVGAAAAANKGAAPAPDAPTLARQASLSRRPSLKARDVAAADAAAVAAAAPAAVGASPSLRRRSLPSSPLAASRHASLEDGGVRGGGKGPLSPCPEHERWWARMDSARFNEPQAPGPMDPPPARPRDATSPRARPTAASDDGGGDDERRARLWSPYSLRRESSPGASKAGPSSAANVSE